MSYANPIIEALDAEQCRTDFPDFRSGDKLRVHARISEGGKERVQVFEGVCVHRSHRGKRGTFTVRKVSGGVGVERVWSINSPRIATIELVTRGRVRRAKLYYLRERRGNSARIRERLKLADDNQGRSAQGKSAPATPAS